MKRQKGRRENERGRRERDTIREEGIMEDRAKEEGEKRKYARDRERGRGIPLGTQQ